MGWLTRVFGGDARAPRDVGSALRGALLAVLGGDDEGAEKLLKDAARLDPDAIDPYLALARLFASRGEIGRAIRIHQNLLMRLDPGTRQGLEVLADLAEDFRKGGFRRRAIASYEEVLAHAPKHRGALAALRDLYEEAREHVKAIGMVRRLARVEGGDPSQAEAELRVAMAEDAVAEGRSHDARRAVKQALRRDRDAVRAWIVLGELEAERGRARAALSAWSRVPEIERSAGRLVYERLEATYAALGRARHFQGYLRGLLEETPEDSGARLALARSLTGSGEIEDGLAELRLLLDRDPDHLPARIQLGRVLLSEGRGPEAVKEYADLLDALERRGPVGDSESSS